MKKLFVWFLVLFAVFGASFFIFKSFDIKTKEVSQTTPKKAILRVALVADSEGQNDLLSKALSQAQGAGVNFVIGLGDWSKVGTQEDLTAAKGAFDGAGIPYYLVPGDHDLWDSRAVSLKSSTGGQAEENMTALANFNKVFGNSEQKFDTKGVRFVLVDNSDIYLGISDEGWKLLADSLQQTANGSKQSAASGPRLTFVFAHKTPFHPDSAHIMGEGSATVAAQAKRFMDLMEQKKADGFFSGDLHFFAKYLSRGQSASGGNSSGSVKITTVGAIDDERNFQGPRFALLTVYQDYSWNVEDVEIR